MRLAIASILLLLATTATGCGGSGGAGSSSADETQLTRASYATKAQEICQRGLDKRTTAVDAAFAERERKGLPVNTAGAFKQVLLDDALPPIKRLTGELKRLSPPDEVSRQASAMIIGFEEGVRQIEAEPAKVLQGADAYGNARKQAKALNIKACSEVF